MANKAYRGMQGFPDAYQIVLNGLIFFRKNTMNAMSQKVNLPAAVVKCSAIRHINVTMITVIKYSADIK